MVPARAAGPTPAVKEIAMPQDTGTKPAEAAISNANKGLKSRLPFDDTQDLDDVRRGFLGTAEENLVKDADGRTVWDLGAYDFLRGDCPTPPTRACGGRAGCARTTACSRSPRASTRSAASTCRT